MSDLAKLERRLEALERAVADIQRQLASAPTSGNWIEKISGSITDVDALREAMEYGRAFRHADRPPDEPDEQEVEKEGMA